MKIVAGKQFFVRKVIVSGVERTKPSVVQERITLQPGDPLNQTALLQMQRRLYDLALFNEVNTAIQNPNGDESYKNILLNLTEAKRWDISYGFGFEVQTGAPAEGCLSPAEQATLGITNSYSCNPNGHTGASPRILFNVSRTNLRGTDQSITLRTNYGTLEQIAMLSYQDPHFRNKPSLNLTLSGGYNNSAVITHLPGCDSFRRLATFAAGDQTHHVDLLLLLPPGFGQFQYPASQPVADPLAGATGAGRGSGHHVYPRYPRCRARCASRQFQHRGDFSGGWQIRLPSQLRPHRPEQFHLLRSGPDSLGVCAANSLRAGALLWRRRCATDPPAGAAVCRAAPPPYRGFPINSAGPRDPQTGYPVGGSPCLSTRLELRPPPPTLRWVGTDLSFVLFHDMGNAFQKSSQVWPSALRTKQPHSYTCRNVTTPYTTYNTPDTCDFNNFSHDVGLGLRYHTPIGPIRGDFSYNLNPPIYPVIYDYTTSATAPNPHVGQAGHFNFFFSIGQSF